MGRSWLGRRHGGADGLHVVWLIVLYQPLLAGNSTATTVARYSSRPANGLATVAACALATLILIVVAFLLTCGSPGGVTRSDWWFCVGHGEEEVVRQWAESKVGQAQSKT